MAAHHYHQNMAFQPNALPQVGLYEEVSSESLPEGWIVINEVNEDGIMEYFINVKTNQTFYTREDLIRYVAYANALQNNIPIAPAPAPAPVADQPQPIMRPNLMQCVRCGSTGHLVHQCRLSDSYVRAMNALYQPIVYRRGQGNHRTTYQCSRCGRYGHNIRSCHAPLVAPNANPNPNPNSNPVEF